MASSPHDDSMFDMAPADPTAWERFSKKFKQEPLVPIGAALTTCALIGASYQMRRGNSMSFNKWLRARIAFQGLTVLAAIGGSYYYATDTAKAKAIANAQELARRNEELARRKELERVARMREQERVGMGRVVPPVPEGRRGVSRGEEAKIEAEQKRALIRKKMAEHAKAEGRALRLPSDADFETRDESPPSRFV